MLTDGSCRLCPRECGARREAGERGACGADAQVRVARAAPHFWEEPCICGEGGSGTVFFSGCSLGCVYCQNREISSGESGVVIPESRLADIFLELQARGVCNINLVTAGHYVPAVVRALRNAKGRGLSLPVVYNSGGYESVETLRMLDGLIDIYLPDFKYTSCALAAKYSHAPDYPEVARAALGEMVRQTGDAVLRGNRLVRGTMVRLLLLPGLVIDAKASLSYLWKTYGNRILYSLMRQYTPMPGIGECYPELDRRIMDREYHSFLAHAAALGICGGYTQEAASSAESFIPPFDHTGVLPEKEGERR